MGLTELHYKKMHTEPGVHDKPGPGWLVLLYTETQGVSGLTTAWAQRPHILHSEDTLTCQLALAHYQPVGLLNKPENFTTVNCLKSS